MKKTLIAAGGSLLLLLGACSKDPGKSDFKKQTADFINKDNGEVAKSLNINFSDASCDEPASTAVGTKYECTATGDDGSSWVFEVEITSKSAFSVQSANPADGGTATTIAGDAAPTTTAA